MICLRFLFAGLAAVNIQVLALDLRGKPEWAIGQPINPPYIINSTPVNLKNPNDPKGTVIENKNVNVVVNVDPKDVAKELWKLIEVRADRTQTRRTDDKKLKIHEIEKIIRPMMSPTRRSNKPSAFEVAYALDHVTRQSLYGDRRRPTIEDEIAAREVVAKMMAKLKGITDKERDYTSDDNYQPIARRMLIFGEDEENYDDNDDDRGGRGNDVDDDNDDDNEYLNLKLTIRKRDLLRRGRTVTYVDF